MNPHPTGRGGRPHAKSLQLCAQVHDALSFALGDVTDPVLVDLVLERVVPMPDEGHLLVAFSDPHGHGVAAALGALDGARAWLRNAIATSIARRRVPQLSFTLVPPGGGP
jgi:ribosome-binding factor A